MRILRLPLALGALIIATLVLADDRAVLAFPPAGSDRIAVFATVDITSRLGNESLMLTGWAMIERQAPRTEGGVAVVDLEIVRLELQGASIVGLVEVTERPNQGQAFVSRGEVRSQLSGQDMPASSFFDLFVDVIVPASPGDDLVLHNEQALRLAPRVGQTEVPLTAWPPLGVTYGLEPIYLFDNDGDTLIDEDTADEDGDGLIDEDRPGPDPSSGPGPGCFSDPNDADCDGQEGEDPPASLCTLALCDADGDGQIDEDPSCIPLLNEGGTHLKAGLCVRNLTIEFAPQLPAFSVARGGPANLHPASVLALVPRDIPPPPSSVFVSGNDQFSQAWTILALPFTGLQSNNGFSLQPNEETSFPCPSVMVPIGSTAWYKYTPPGSGLLVFSTDGSSFDTVLVAYTGSTIEGLTQVACNDDIPGPGLHSQIVFAAAGGVTYHIQVGTYDSFPPGNIVLSVASEGAQFLEIGEAPFVRISCDNLGLTADGCDDGTDGDQDDVNALSFGGLGAAMDSAGLQFSVAPGAQGLPGSAVETQVNCPPSLPGTSPEPEPDIFASTLTGSNSHFMDGNGPIGSCPSAFPLGLLESAMLRDNLDALDAADPIAVDGDDDGVPEAPVYFSLDTASPSLASLGKTASDVLKTAGGSAPTVYASTASLGLMSGDDIDGLCLQESGDGVYDPSIDLLFFSLSPGSPTLAFIGANPGDLLAPGTPPSVTQTAASIGLMASDDANAFACEKLPTVDTDGDTIPNVTDPDDDNDGCTDLAELGSNPSQGGQRNPHYFWDFFDPNQDRSVSILDFFAELQRFNTVGDPTIDPLSPPPPAPSYHPRFDRGARIGPNVWDLAPPNGSISLTDFFGLLGQFGHSCGG